MVCFRYKRELFDESDLKQRPRGHASGSRQEAVLGSQHRQCELGDAGPGKSWRSAADELQRCDGGSLVPRRDDACSLHVLLRSDQVQHVRENFNQAVGKICFGE